MNINTTILIFAGGVGSGPHTPCPTCGPHHKHASEGDMVAINKDLKMTTKYGDNFNVKRGSVAKVVSVLPKIGNAEQMAQIHVKQDDDPEVTGYVPVHSLTVTKGRDDLDLPEYTKSYTRQMNLPKNPLVNVPPVKPSQTIMKTTTGDGAKLTWIKPKDQEEPSIKSLKQLSMTPHGLKGDFNILNTVPAGELNNPGQNRVVRVYDTKGLPTQYVQGKGSTVTVSTLTKGKAITGINVREQNYTTHGQLMSTITFDYKNAAQAIGMLRQRYGITTSMKSIKGRK